jgi:hypothetical protein
VCTCRVVTSHRIVVCRALLVLVVFERIPAVCKAMRHHQSPRHTRLTHLAGVLLLYCLSGSRSRNIPVIRLVSCEACSRAHLAPCPVTCACILQGRPLPTARRAQARPGHRRQAPQQQPPVQRQGSRASSTPRL